MTKYATINPLDNSVYEIHDVAAASDLPVMPPAPYVVAATDEAAKGDIYDPITATFKTPDPPDPPATSRTRSKSDS